MYAARKAAEAARRGDQAALRFWTHVRDTVDQAPPLTDDQRDRLAVLLRPCRARATAGATQPAQAA
jgi:hypothetical protein